MKRILTWSLRVAGGAVLLVILIFIFKDTFLRVVVERRIQSLTGMEARIGKYSSGVLSPGVAIEDLKVYNTAEFGGTPFLVMPEFKLELDPAGLAQHKLHITQLRINLAELDIVRNEAGQTNLYALRNRMETAGSGEDSMKQQLGDFQFDGIDVLNLSLGKARYIDLGDARNNREISVNLQNQLFRNVKSEADLYGMLFLIWLRSGGGFPLGPVKAGGAAVTNH